MQRAPRCLRRAVDTHGVTLDYPITRAVDQHHPHADADADADAYADSHADAYADSHADAYADSHADAGSHPEAAEQPNHPRLA